MARRLARRGKPFRRVLADRVEHPEPGLAEYCRLADHQRLIQQRAQRVQHASGRDLLVRTDPLRHLDRPAGEVRQPSQQHLLPLRQQVVAPVDRGAQRPLAWRRGPVPERQQPEPVGHPHPDLVDGERADPGSGQLDRQRDPVEGTAKFRDGAGVFRGERETWGSSQRPFGKKLDSIPWRRAGGGNGQRGHRPHRLTGDPQRLATGGQQPQLSRARQQPLAQPGAGVEQVLAVVEREQQPAQTQRVGQRVEQRAAALLRHTRGGRDAGGHQVRVGQVGQVHIAGPVGKLGGHRGEHAQRQPGLPDAARTRQREHAGTAHELAQLVELPLTADKAVRFLGQGCAYVRYLTRQECSYTYTYTIVMMHCSAEQV